jgi:hypothetical protein
VSLLQIKTRIVTSQRSVTCFYESCPYQYPTGTGLAPHAIPVTLRNQGRGEASLQADQSRGYAQSPRNAPCSLLPMCCELDVQCRHNHPSQVAGAVDRTTL